MSSQKKVIQFIKDHYDGDMDRALQVLADAIGKKAPIRKFHGRPTKEQDLESFWYGIVYCLCHIEKRFLDTSDKVVRVKTGGIRKAIEAIRPFSEMVNKEWKLDVIPNPSKYGEWKKKNIPKLELNENSIAGTTIYSNDNVHFCLYLNAIEYEKGCYENEITLETFPQ